MIRVYTVCHSTSTFKLLAKVCITPAKRGYPYIVLFLQENVLLVLIRSALAGASNEYGTHNTFSWKNKKKISIFRLKKAPYLEL